MKRSGRKVHEPGTADLGKWRRLARVATLATQAAPPAGAIADLARCSRIASRAIIIGVEGSANSCIRLKRGADEFIRQSPDVRARPDVKAALLLLAAEVQAILAGLQPFQPPVRRFRKDIDG